MTIRSTAPRYAAWFLTFAFLIAAAAAAKAQTTPVLHVAVTNTDGYEAYFAQDTGMFARAGLNVDVQNLGQGAAVAAAVTGHSVDIGISNVVTIAQGRERGLAFTFIAPGSLYLSTASNAQILVSPDSAIHAAKDLNGKIVAATTTAGITRLAGNAWIDKNGGDSTTVKFIEMPPSEMLPALERGTIAAAMINDPILTAVRPKLRVLGSPFDAFGPKIIVTGWFAAGDWIAANRTVAAAFAKVMAEAARWGNDPKNHAQAAAIVTKYTKGQADPGQTVYAVSFDEAPIQPIVDTAVKYGMLAHALAGADLISRP